MPPDFSRCSPEPMALRTEAYAKQLTGDKCLDHPKHALQNEKSPSSLGK
jgi:hypothetical protein